MVDSYRQASYILDIRQEADMATIAKNRISKFLPKIIGGAFYSLGNHFVGQPATAEQVREFIVYWTAAGLGKMTLDGTKGCYRLHSNEWAEFEVAA
jgi:hypothetical protein